MYRISIEVDKIVSLERYGNFIDYCHMVLTESDALALNFETCQVGQKNNMKHVVRIKLRITGKLSNEIIIFSGGAVQFRNVEVNVVCILYGGTLAWRIAKTGLAEDRHIQCRWQVSSHTK